MTSAVAETFVIGDVDGAQTGDAGEVIWTAYTTNDKTAPSATATLNLNARDFLTIRLITFVGCDANPSIITAGVLSSNVTIEQCTFIPSRSGQCINWSGSPGVAANWTVDRCIFMGQYGQAAIRLNPQTDTVADWDLLFTIKNCNFYMMGNSTAVNMTASGANSKLAGGLDVFNCCVFGGATGIQTSNTATSIPSTVCNCQLIGLSGSALSAGASGQIVEDSNFIQAGTNRTNVTAGTKSIASGSNGVMPYSGLFELGQSHFIGRQPRSMLSHLPNSPMLGFGAQSGGPSTDILGLNRSAGSILKGDNGTVSSATNLTLTDTSKLFPSGGFKGYSVRILTGIGSGQVKTINDNNTGTLRVDGFWNPTPTVNSTYLIYAGATATMGQTTSGGALSNTRIEDANAKWGTNQWLGFTIGFASGAGASGEFISSVVSGNTSTIITATGSFARNPASGDSYQLYKGSGVFFVNPSVGCYERGNTAIKETGTVRTAGTGIRIQGPGTQDFDIPVDFSATTISVYGRYDTEYSGILPQLIIRNGEECGVSPKSGTMTVGVNTWEQLSLVVNPSGKGVITARLQSNSVTPAGATFWDDFATI